MSTPKCTLHISKYTEENNVNFPLRTTFQLIINLYSRNSLKLKSRETFLAECALSTLPMDENTWCSLHLHQLRVWESLWKTSHLSHKWENHSDWYDMKFESPEAGESDLYISAFPWTSSFPENPANYLLSLIIYKCWDDDTAFGSRSVHDFILLSPENL